MPNIYISPSTQEYNPYITGSGSEEYWMNRIADAMEPYLRANTIRFTRNTPDMTAASSIAQAARGSYDFYLALHSNASGDGSTEGRQRGIIAFYYPTSANGRRAANIFVENLKEIYPLPSLVTARATTALGEVRQPAAVGAAGDRLSRQHRRRGVDTGQRAEHRGKPVPVAGRVLRPALYLSHDAPNGHSGHGAGRPERAGLSGHERAGGGQRPP